MPVGTVGAVKTFSPESLSILILKLFLATHIIYFLDRDRDHSQAGGLHAFTSWQTYLNR